MKTFNNIPFGGKIIEEETTLNKWDIVTIHYEGFDTEKYRAVKYNSEKVIIAERSFNTREMAEAYIAQQS
jgi:hypothetical protein